MMKTCADFSFFQGRKPIALKIASNIFYIDLAEILRNISLVEQSTKSFFNLTVTEQRQFFTIDPFRETQIRVGTTLLCSATCSLMPGGPFSQGAFN